MVAKTMEKWEQAIIEAPMGEDATYVLSEAIRLLELRARVAAVSALRAARSGSEGGGVGRCGADMGAGTDSENVPAYSNNLTAA